MDTVETLSELISAHRTAESEYLAKRNLLIARAKSEGVSNSKLTIVTGLSRQQVNNIIADQLAAAMRKREQEDFLAWITRDMSAEEARAYRHRHTL